MPEIIFILYKPAVPGNVGASARAIKTMGFIQLRLIQPCDYLDKEARMMAHGSHDILEQASVFESYEEAIKDIDFIICTTAKNRSAKFDYYSSHEIGGLINDKSENLKKVGVVFGCEESGLPNSIIQHADLAITIPMHSVYPSLNLSQSVMIISYELSSHKSQEKTKTKSSKNSESFRELTKRTKLLLENIGVAEGTPLHHRIMERVAILKSGDIPLLHSVTSKAMDHLKKQS